jgi:hypothetical protein
MHKIPVNDFWGKGLASSKQLLYGSTTERITLSSRAQERPRPHPHTKLGNLELQVTQG